MLDSPLVSCFFPPFPFIYNISSLISRLSQTSSDDGQPYLFNIKNSKDQRIDNKGPWGYLWMALVTNVVGVSTLIDYWLKIGTSAGVSAADSHDNPPRKLMKRFIST